MRKYREDWIMTEVLTTKITKKKVDKALSKTKKHKAVGPDPISIKR